MCLSTNKMSVWSLAALKLQAVFEQMPGCVCIGWLQVFAAQLVHILHSFVFDNSALYR